MSQPALDDFQNTEADAPTPDRDTGAVTHPGASASIPRPPCRLPWHWVPLFERAGMHPTQCWIALYVLTHAKLLDGKWIAVWADRSVAKALGVSKNTSCVARRALVEAGLIQIHQEGDYAKGLACEIDATRLFTTKKEKK